MTKPDAELLVELGAHGVVTVTFNRPATLNALTFEGYAALRDTFRSFESDTRVRAVVLTGAGDGFCSGGDREKIVPALARMSAEELLAFARLTGDSVLAMRELGKPIVAAVNGAAVGAGAVLALAADFRVVSDRARFGFVFSKLGLSGADMGAAWLLSRTVGQARATELLMLGHVIEADVANRFGLVSYLVPHAELATTARVLATRLAAGPTEALAITKRMLNQQLGVDLREAIEAEAQTQAECMQSEAFRAAARRSWKN
ncbi:MAG TPA: enoyl-CoA hydratase-related protein [Polyangia bacterium]|nr:enoyl-CoA hydratase-related protein [Polyangia bacterium]